MTMRDHRDYVRVAVDVAANPKLAAVKAEAKWLHVVALCVAGRDLTDGQIRGRVVAAEADVNERNVTALIKAGAWHQRGHDCDRCPQPDLGFLYIHDYLLHQRSRDEAHRARRAGKAGAAARWGAKGNAAGNADRIADGNALRNSKRHAVPIAEVEVEVEVEGVTGSQSSLDRRDAATSDGLDLQRVATRLGSDLRWAKRVGDDILGRASTDVRDPTAYVLRAIDDRPADYRPTPTAPKLGDLCIHAREAATCPWTDEH